MSKADTKAVKILTNETGTIQVKVLGYYSPITKKVYKRKSNRTVSEQKHTKAFS